MLSSANLISNLILNGKSSSSRKLAIITGATSGIGKAYAVYFAGHGYDLLITGRRREVIHHVALELISNYGIKVDVIIADLSKNEDLSLLLQVLGKRKNIEVLVNNAGYGMDCRFSNDELNHQMAMLKVHVDAPLMLIHKVLPIMMENNRGIIINVSSLAAYMPTASNAMYTSTKSFLKSFTESLYMDVSNYGIQVQCLCPGFTYSDFHRNLSISGDGIKQGFVHWMNPSAVVDYSMNCLDRGQVVCIPGFLNRVMSFLTVHIPRGLYYPIAVKMDRKIRKQNHMPDLAYMRAVQGKSTQHRNHYR
jgi:uncharacterized protein